jgi:hypothetical protein
VWLVDAMSWKARDEKIYEARVVADSLARLAKRFDVTELPFSGEELHTLAKRARESFLAYRSDEKKKRLARYKARLSSLHGEEIVGPVWAALEEINNEIGYEEK